MILRKRKIRLGLVLGIALVLAYVAWRTGNYPGAPAAQKACVAGRQEIKDDKGNVIQVIRTTCRE